MKLPNANAISKIHFLHTATHATAIAITLDLVEVLVNGAPILSLSGSDLRKITKFDTGHDFAAPASGTTSTSEGVVHFGRTPRDSVFCLPAPLFQNVQVRFQGSLSATPVLNQLSIEIEEVLGVNLKGAIMRKRSIVGTLDPAASQQWDTELPRTGNPLAAIYVDYATAANVDGALVQLGVNNFTRRHVDMRRTAIEAFNRQSFPFDDDAIPDTMFCLDLDPFGDPSAALDTRGLSDVKLRLKASASGDSGTVRVIAEEYVPAA